MTDHPRRYCRRSVIAFLASAASWPCCRAASQLEPNQSLPQILASLIDNPRSASAIGAACLKSLPANENSIQQLTDAILTTGCDIEPMTTKQAAKSRIVNQIRDDFAEGAVVNVDGWFLSVTEARLYALVALSLGSMK
jgi:hypothetical protein